MARTKKPAPAPEAPATLPALAQDSKPNDIKPVMIDVDQIAVTYKHDRTWNETLEKQVGELAASMAKQGLQQPIRVHERGFLEKHGGKSKTLTDEAAYGLTFGELRLAAAKKLGWKQIPATIGQVADIRAERAVENLQRPELGVGAKMVLVGELMSEITAGIAKEFGVKDGEEISAQVADAIRRRAVDICQARTGMRPEQIRDLMFLSDLDETTRTLVLEERLPWQYARKLAAVADPEARAEIARRHAAARPEELPSPLRDLEDAIARVTNVLDHVPWKLDVAFSDAPACKDCPSNSINQTGLFDGTVKERNPGGYGLRDKPISAAGVCLKDSCFRAKLGAFNRATANMARKVAITVKGADPKQKDAAKRAPVNLAAPEWASEDKFKKQVREKAKLKAEAAAAPATAGGTKVKKIDTAEQKARSELDDAVHVWIRGLEASIEKALAKDQMAKALVKMLEWTDKITHLANRYGGAKKPTPAMVKAAEELIDLATEGTSGAFDEIVGRLGEFDDPDWWSFTDGMKVRIAENLSVEVPPMPKLEDFLPKPEPKKADAAMPGKGGKRAAPASGKKKAKKSKPSDDAQAVRDLAADAAGEIDPQEVV